MNPIASTSTRTFEVAGNHLLLTTEACAGGIDATVAASQAPMAVATLNQLQGIVGRFTREMQRTLECRVSHRIDERAVLMRIDGGGPDAVRAYLAKLPEYVRAHWPQPRVRRVAAGAASGDGDETVTA